MRRHLYFLLKEQLCLELRKTRISLKLTQEKMAELLSMSTRAYVSLEGGKILLWHFDVFNLLKLLS